MNTIELPLTYATAGVVGLGGLALLMGAALASLAELLALLPRRRGWAGYAVRPPGSDLGRSGAPRPRAGALVATVLAWQDGTDAYTRQPDSGEVRVERDARES